MKDNELFDLCKQVYEKTGWTTNFAIFKLGERIWSSDHEIAPVVQGNPDNLQFFKKPIKADNRKDPYEVAPLYTSDYLLEKLPSGTRVQKDSAMMGEAQLYVASMVYFKGTPKEHDLNCGDKTSSLKALLKLTLALHEAGELS